MAAPSRAPGIRPGPMAVLVLVLALCLAVLAVLAMATAAAARHRADVQAAMTVDSYANEASAQELLADAVAAAREGGADAWAALAEEVPRRWPGASATVDGDGRLLAAFVQPSGRRLDVELSCDGAGTVVVEAWRASTTWEEPSHELWQGS
ncbi:hypothetical protein [Caniella muris]|uniref:hypothetical protein n=1 Tax=Caniella muris TaxID=2941502 RepID=UPI002041B541|nr:hypothetical protein [Caniella muris]